MRRIPLVCCARAASGQAAAAPPRRAMNSRRRIDTSPRLRAALSSPKAEHFCDGAQTGIKTLNSMLQPMSALPQKRTCAAPKSRCPLSAKSGHRHLLDHLVGVASSDGGTVRPSALAVLRLITSSYLVGACTGRSAGFSPFRMRST